jgi:hypothetical protein
MFKINIRDTQGTDGYPTRMMCDFKPKWKHLKNTQVQVSE